MGGVFRRRCTGRKPVGLFCMQRKMGTAENEIGKGESVCLWAEGKIVFLMFDTVRAQCKHKPRLSNRAWIRSVSNQRSTSKYRTLVVGNLVT
jgi:hypothetical protein